MVKTNKGHPKVDSMGEEELAKYFEANKDDTSGWETTPLKIRNRRGGPSTILSLRLAPEELEEIHRAATSRGKTVSDFIRSTALAASRSEDPNVDAIREALTTLRAASEAIEQTQHALESAG